MQPQTRAALLAFGVSRALLFALLIAGSQMSFVQKVYSGSVWETRIQLQWSRLAPELERVTMSGDAWWYRTIALKGYERRPFDLSRDANWAFFPLFPKSVRALRLSGNFAIDALIVSNLAFLAALLMLAELIVAAGGTWKDASRAVFYAAFFPTSYFYSLPQSESLFLLLAVGAFLAAERGVWWAAGMSGGLAALTSVTGVLLFPALILFAIERRHNARWRLLWLLLIPLSLAGFMLRLNRLTGNPLAFLDIQPRFGHSLVPFWRPLLGYLRCPWCVSEPWNLVALNFAIAILLLVAGVAFAVQRQWAYAFFTLASILVPLSGGSLQSIGRYALTAFPLFFWLSVRGRNVEFDRCFLVISTALYGCLIALMALRVDFALT